MRELLYIQGMERLSQNKGAVKYTGRWKKYRIDDKIKPTYYLRRETMDFKTLAKERYSVRKFSDRPVEKDKLQKVLEAALLAPTAKNQQPFRIYVLQSEEAIEKISKLSHCVYGAKTVLVFTYNRDEEWKNPVEQGVTSGVEDVSIAATYLMFQATELGLYTTWCNMFPNTELEKVFGLPENERSVIMMPIGYKADGVEPAPTHTQSRPMSDIVRYL